jgi:hypothetical protein
MGRRLDLHALLLTIADNVYFQPPTGTQLQYPCITYQRYNGVSIFADNAPYKHTRGYQVIVIDPDPDGIINDKVEMLPMCRRNRFFVVGNLNHDVFNLYY